MFQKSLLYILGNFYQPSSYSPPSRIQAQRSTSSNGYSGGIDCILFYSYVGITTVGERLHNQHWWH